MGKAIDLIVGEYRDVDHALSLAPDPVAEELFCPLISVDDHVLEPRTLFSRVPQRFRDAAPRLTEGERPAWIIGDRKVAINGMNAAVGRPMDEWNVRAMGFSEMRRAIYDPLARIADMDVSGIWASLNFPSAVWGFAGKRFLELGDAALGLACVKAYNDWMLEEWCNAAPDRFISCQVAWLGDADDAAAEIRRNAARGFRSVTFSENPEGLGLPGIYSGYWDPFFAACEETGTVVNLHVGSSGNIPCPSADTPNPARVALFPLKGIETVVDWIFARIPQKFPSMRIVLSEAGASWVPMVLERLERANRQRNASDWWTAKDPHPHEYLRQSFWFASIEDPSSMRMLDLIGEDRVMLESDYPHTDSTWPESQALITRELAGLSGETIRKLCYENAAGLYDHPTPPTEWLQRSAVAGMGAVV